MIPRQVIVRCAIRWMLTMALVTLAWVASADTFDAEMFGLVVVGVLLVPLEVAVWRLDDEFGGFDGPSRRGTVHAALAMALALPGIVGVTAYQWRARPEGTAQAAPQDWPMSRSAAAFQRYREANG